MDTIAIVIVVLAVLAVLAIAGYFISTRRRSAKLRDRYGSEYERAVQTSGRRGDAEKELLERDKRVSKLHIRELNRDEQHRYAEEWRVVQADFVDEPAKAIKEADALVQRVMSTMGYPITDFEQQAADVSVDHPEVVKNYRAGHAIAEAHEEEPQDTELLRQAMLHYRALFTDLLGTPAASTR